MIAAPKQMMAALCGSPVNNARQLIYQYITSYHDVLVRDIVDFNKMLSFQHTETPKIGPLTEQVLKNLHAYYQIMEKGVLLNLSEDVMVARLADESFKMDLLLSQFGEKITGSVFDTFHEADMTKLALLSEDIKKGLREKCES
ncbi:hypothetical protein PU02_0348 [Bartonella ancashensis]|uniref:Uncharacterized protein n=2 Tax=Bartonella ancashensis TaxID=1318743 RepID=A0A0M4M2N2_9HYPH|nr:hypothetical protein PU02_0348 [Bartonella ancashensis]